MQWVKNLTVAAQVTEVVWVRPQVPGTVAVQVQSLAQEHPYSTGAAIKKNHNLISPASLHTLVIVASSPLEGATEVIHSKCKFSGGTGGRG